MQSNLPQNDSARCDLCVPSNFSSGGRERVRCDLRGPRQVLPVLPLPLIYAAFAAAGNLCWGPPRDSTLRPLCCWDLVLALHRAITQSRSRLRRSRGVAAWADPARPQGAPTDS